MSNDNGFLVYRDTDSHSMYSEELSNTSTDAVVMIIKHKVMVIFWEVSKYHEPVFISNPPKKKNFILERTSYISYIRNFHK